MLSDCRGLELSLLAELFFKISSSPSTVGAAFVGLQPAFSATMDLSLKLDMNSANESTQAWKQYVEEKLLGREVKASLLFTFFHTKR